MRMPARPIAFHLIVASTALLAACGKGNDDVAKGPVHKGVYTSAADCEASGKLSIEICARAMEIAVAEHETNAPSYGSLRNCEDKEGKDTCERTEEKYRPQLQAFLVIASEPPQAVPLYAPPANAEGFRGADKKTYLATDETIAFSEHAAGLAEINKEMKRK